MRTLNVHLLLLLILLTGAAATGIHFLHDWQLNRNAQFLLTLADRFEETGQAGKAVGSLARYVALVPGDTDALARLGLLHAKRHADVQAHAVLEQVLRREPMRDDIRRELVDVAMRIGRYTDARDHLEQHLLRANRNDARNLNLLGACLDKLGDSAAAAKQFELAIKAQPGYLDSYVSLARLYTRNKEPDRADKVLEALVESNRETPNAYRAYLLRASFRYEQVGNPMSQFDRDAVLAQAEADTGQALGLEGDKSEALLLAAELARVRALAHPDDDSLREHAREYITQGLALYENGEAKNTKTQAGLFRLLASLELDDGRRDLAIEVLGQAIAAVRQPDENIGLQWLLAEVLIDDERLADARTVIDGLREEAVFAPFVAYLDARLKLADGNWQEGAADLERLRPRLAEIADLSKQVDFWLGRCYGALNREQPELAAYRRAIEADDHWVAARCTLAAALTKAGRTHEAIEQYRAAIQLAGCPAEVYLAIARLRAGETLRQPSTKQDWKEIEVLLKTASQRMPDSAEITVMQAQAEVARGAWEDARARLDEATESHPNELSIWLSRIALERLAGDWLQAERLLTAAQKHLGDRVELRLEQASIVEGRDGANAVTTLLSLAEDISTFSSDEQSRLRVGVARHLQAVGAVQQAKAFAEQVAAESPQNLAANLMLFDLAVAEGDLPAMEKWRKAIQGLPDPDASPLSLYGDAVRLVLSVEASTERSSETHRASLQTASDELSEARNQRPSWPRLALLQARIEELRDKPARAIPWYQQAVDLGAGDEVAIHLIVLLAEQKEYEQAERLLRRLDEKQAALTPEVAPSAFDALSHRNDFVKALDLAFKACQGSDDCQHHIWFGRVATEVALAGKLRAEEQENWLAKAEQAFQKAIELDQHQPGGWLNLLTFYARTAREPNLEEAIERAKQQLAPTELHLLLTSYYQSIEDLRTAREQLELALLGSPDDPKTLRHASEFHLMRRELADAKLLLERLLQPTIAADPNDRAFARQSLAVVYLTDGTYGSFCKAIELVKGDDPDAPSNRRAMAILLARSPAGKDRLRAIELLKELAAKSLLDDSDRFLLAQLLWRRRQRDEALGLMESLVERAPNNPSFVAGYARMLLDDNRLESAERWIKRLEGLEPKAVPTAELRARDLASRHRETKAISVLESLLTSQAAPGEDLPTFSRRQLATLFESIGNWKPARGAPRAEEFFNAAEKHLRQTVAESVTKPEDEAALAGFLGRHGKVKEALHLFDQLWSTEQFEAAAIGYADLASQGKLAPSQLVAAERQINQLLADHPESILLLSALARTYRASGKFDHVEATYRKILEISPDSVIALNNLAVLLTLRETKGKEARQLIDRAVELGGPGTALLDSRAMVELAAGDDEAAIKDLEEATADEPLPECYFHLAQAYLRRNHLNAAAEAIEKARSIGLDEHSLHPLERDAYQQILALVPQPAVE